MHLKSEPESHRYAIYSQSASIVVFGVGVVVLVFGWILDIAALKTAFPFIFDMKANTAAGFILLGTSLWLLQERRATSINSRIAMFLVSIVIILGGLSFVEFIFSINLGIDELLVKEPTTVRVFTEGRMSPITGVCFVLSGTAVLMLEWKQKFQANPSNLLSLIAVTLSLLAVAGHLTSTTMYQTFFIHPAMALLTAGAFLAFSFGVFNARRRRSIGKTRLERQIFSGFTVAFLITLSVGIVSFQNINELLQAENQIEHTYIVMAELDNLLAMMNDIQAATRRFAVTGEEISLEQYDEAAPTIQPGLQRLRDLTSDNIQQQHNLDSLETHIRERIEFAVKTIEIRRRNGREAALQLIATDVGTRLMNEIKSTLDKMKNVETALLHERKENESKQANKTASIIFVAVIFILLLFVLVYYIIKHFIQERKKAEENLIKSNEFLDAIFENIPNMIFVKDARELRFVRFNKAGEDLLGYDRKQLLGKNDYDFFPKKEADFFTQKDREVLSGKTLLDIPEETIQTVQQGERWLHTKKIPVIGSDGTPEYLLGISEDITMQKEYQRTILEGKTQFAKMFYDNPTAMCITNIADGSFIDMNNSFLKTYGYTREELLGKTSLEIELVFPEARKKNIEMMKERGFVRNIELKTQTKTKDIRDVLISIEPIDLGGVPHVFTILLDITERKHLEEVLQESEVRYRLLFEQIPFSAWVYDAKTLSFLTINKVAIDHYGYTEEEFLGMTLKDIRPEEDISALMNDVAATTAELNNAGIWRHRKKDGTIFYVEIISQVIVFSGKSARLVIAIDITERKKAQDELKQSNERFTKIFNLSPVPTYITQVSDGKIIYANEALEHFFLLKQNDIIGKSSIEIHILSPERREELIHQMLVSGWKTEGVDLRVQIGNGEFRDVLASSDMVEIDGIKCFLATMIDITELKQAEQERKKLIADLEISTAQLQSANRELESFSYSVSHDLRAPLRAIDGFSRIITEDYATQLDEDGKRYLNVIMENTRQMGQLIDDLLSFSRLSRQEMLSSTIDMNYMVRSLVHEAKQAESNSALSIVVNNLESATGDSTLIRQVWVNLISNAIKYSRKKEQPTIEIGSYLNEREQIYFVKDNGAGFDERYAHKLFGVFQRLHSKEEFEGTGVGLAIVQRVIFRHGGNVWAEGSIGKGACFYFSLPKS